MMDVLMRYHDGEGPKTPQGLVDYLGVHLQASREIGDFKTVDGYLNKEGEVLPLVQNRELWRGVGWSGEGLPPENLIKNLVMGFDLAGNKLNASRALFKPPKELLLTLWCELSEALRHRPDVAHAILCQGLAANTRCLEEEATRQRSGKGRKVEADWARAQVLELDYLHAENRGKEAAYHAHALIFPACLSKAGTWRAFNNLAHISKLSKPGGARDQVTSAMISEAARWGYKVEVARGKSTGAGSQGARVTCPDGHVIERGSIKRNRRAIILACQEMVRELGAPPLTPKQVELVRRETGRFPAEMSGVKLREALEKKLRILGFLDREGRIQEAAVVMAALARMEVGMAVAQVSLQDLPDLPSAGDGAEIIKERRKALVQAVPELSPNTDQARIRWTAAYDEALELVAAHPEGLGTDNLNKHMRDNLSKLKRAGVLAGEKIAGRMLYRLGPNGTERLHSGRREQSEVEAAVTTMVQSAMEDYPSPDLVRGRLEMVGITTNPRQDRFEVGAVGRVLQAPELIEKTGIGVETPVTPDLPWWERWLDQLRQLPQVLKKAIMAPAEVLQRWCGEIAETTAGKLSSQARHRLSASAAAKHDADDYRRRLNHIHQATNPAPISTNASLSNTEGEIGHGRTH